MNLLEQEDTLSNYTKYTNQYAHFLLAELKTIATICHLTLYLLLAGTLNFFKSFLEHLEEKSFSTR